ncbi:2704_t:CDS:2, partial [Racocetra fulgida]
NRSKIPEVLSKQRPNYGKNRTSKYTKMVLDKLAERKDLCENSNNTESCKTITKTGEYDVWAQGSKKFYFFMDFELLMMAHEEEVVKLNLMQRINSKLPYSVDVSSSLNVENMIEGNDESSEDDVESEETKEKAIQTKEHRKKTKAERNKEKRKMEKIKEEEQRKTQKNFMKEFEKLPEIIKTVENECAEHEKKMIERTKLAEEPEGNLFRERMISYEERNIIEPRVLV